VMTVGEEPKTPPTAQSVTASVVNWARMFRRVVHGLRTPISRVRSVNGDEHDVHDADTADHQATEETAIMNATSAGELRPELGERIGTHDFKVVIGFNLTLRRMRSNSESLLRPGLVLLVIVGDRDDVSLISG